jgi:hypothetical protein
VTAESDRFLLRWAGWSIPRKALFIGAVVVLVAGLGYAFSAALRSTQFYRYLKTSERGWTDGVFTADDELGFVPVRGSTGLELMPIVPAVPACFDAEGFRVPDARPAAPASGLALLALGCS